HHAELVELDAWDPVRPVTAQADHADLRDIRVVDRGQPADLGDGARVGGTQLDLDAVGVDELDLPPVAPQPLALDGDLVIVRGAARGLEMEHRALGAEPIEGRRVVPEAADAGGFVHAHVTRAPAPGAGPTSPTGVGSRGSGPGLCGRVEPPARRAARQAPRG